MYIQDQLNKVGIVAHPDVQETASAYERLNARAFDLAPCSHGYALDDPDALFAEFYTEAAPRNYSEVSSPEVEELFLKQSQELDLEARKEIAREMELVSLQLYSKVIVTWSSGTEPRWTHVQDRVKYSSLYNNWRFEETWLRNV